MSTHPKTRAAQPLPVCALPHHQPGQRVQFHQWNTPLRRMERITGTVAAHHNRRITINTSRGPVTTECGHVTPEGHR